jgi:hypothetical protein
MHLADPQAAIRELLRVTKPGGVILCAEPNSLSAFVMLSSTNFSAPVDDVLDLVRFGLTCERGKAGSATATTRSATSCRGTSPKLEPSTLQSYACDKTHALYPPYASEEQQALRGYYLGGFEKMLGRVRRRSATSSPAAVRRRSSMHRGRGARQSVSETLRRSDRSASTFSAAGWST